MSDHEIQELDDRLSPETAEALQRWRMACQSIYTGLADVKARDSIKQEKVNE